MNFRNMFMKHFDQNLPTVHQKLQDLYGQFLLGGISAADFGMQHKQGISVTVRFWTAPLEFFMQPTYGS